MNESVFSLREQQYILCVDDDQSVLNQLVTQLEEAFGDLCQIESTESAEEALDLLENIAEEGGKTLVVISDQVMPGMKGDRFLEKINTLYPDTHKILLTGYAGLESAMYAINHANLDKYLEKPWNKHEFIATVQHLLGPSVETFVAETAFRMREALQNVMMFRDLSIDAIDLLAEKLRLVQFPHNTMIFRIDDPGDCLYIIKSGEVKVIAGMDENDEVLAYLGRGSYFGEMALLTGEARSASVMTSLDTDLFMLTKADFDDLLVRQPSMAVTLSHVLSQRLRSLSIKKAGRQNKIIGVLNTMRQASEKMLVIEIARKLAKETNGNVIIIESAGRSAELADLLNLDEKQTTSHWILENLDNIQEEQLTQLLPGDGHGVKFFFLPESDNPPLVMYIIKLLSLCKEYYNFVFIHFPIETTLNPGVIKTMEQAATILYLMKVAENSTENIICLRTLHENYAQLMKKVEVVIARETSTQGIPEAVSTLVERHHLHYLRLEHESVRFLLEENLPPVAPPQPSTKKKSQIVQDVSRIARRLGNVSVGLVLGGGGARAYAHLGVLKVLQEENIPIDILAGTSMGAFLGALHIMGKSVDEILQISLESWKKLNSPLSWTLPRIAFIKAKRIRHVVHEIFGDILIEDLPLPFFCVAGDLVSGQEVVMGQGKLYEAVLASGALPGFFAPVSSKNMYLVDGGVVNNVPGDVLKKQGIDVVIAVDVTPEREVHLIPSPDSVRPDDQTPGPVQQAWTSLKRMKMRYGSILLPRIIMRVMAIEGLEITRNKSHHFDIHLKPNLEDFDLFDFKHLPEIIAIGEQTGRAQVAKIRETILSLKR